MYSISACFGCSFYSHNKCNWSENFQCSPLLISFCLQPRNHLKLMPRFLLLCFYNSTQKINGSDCVNMYQEAAGNAILPDICSCHHWEKFPHWFWPSEVEKQKFHLSFSLMLYHLSATAASCCTVLPLPCCMRSICCLVLKKHHLNTK